MGLLSVPSCIRTCLNGCLMTPLPLTRSGVTSPSPSQQLSLSGFLRHWLVSVIYPLTCLLRDDGFPSCCCPPIEMCLSLQNVTDMIQLERPDWQQVMAYVTAIYKHFETWRTQGPVPAHLVSIQCCVQMLFIAWYFSSYSCKQSSVCDGLSWSREKWSKSVCDRHFCCVWTEVTIIQNTKMSTVSGCECITYWAVWLNVCLILS
jgi:hypothetical protein